MVTYTIIYQEHTIQKAFVEILAVKVYFVWNEEKLDGIWSSANLMLKLFGTQAP